MYRCGCATLVVRHSEVDLAPPDVAEGGGHAPLRVSPRHEGADGGLPAAGLCPALEARSLNAVGAAISVGHFTAADSAVNEHTVFLYDTGSGRYQWTCNRP